MSQFNPDELASFGKEETQKKDVSHNASDRTAKRIPLDTPITHHGEIIGDLSSIAEDARCDCPDGVLHSDGLGDDYAHTVRLSGGDIGISCSGDSCAGLFIPDTPMHQSDSINTSDEKLDVRQLDDDVLLHFTPEMIPEPIRRWTLDNCLQTEGSLNYGAVAAITVCSNLIGMRCQVKPKQHGSWKLTPNLWSMVIGEPSKRKSPVVEQFLKPVQKLEIEAVKVYKSKMGEFESDELEHSIAQKTKKSTLENAYKAGDEKRVSEAKAMYVPAIEEPRQERFIVNDATTEKIGEIMSKSERTLLLYRDELAGFYASLSKTGREGDRPFYLEAFKGDSPYTYDRIGRGTLVIEKLSIGLLGTIQPSVLAKYVISKNGETGDGLSQRMQLAVFADSEERPYYDEPMDSDVRDDAYELIKKLAYESFEQMPGAQLDYDGTPYFTFNDVAQQRFIQWYNAMKVKESNEPDNSVHAHLGKYYGLLPSLALAFFLIDKVAEVTDAPAISLSHLEMAIEWCEVLETHARKMYALANTETNSKSKQQKVIDAIKKNQNELPMSFGRISQLARAGKADDIEKLLQDIAVIEGRRVIKLLV